MVSIGGSPGRLPCVTLASLGLLTASVGATAELNVPAPPVSPLLRADLMSPHGLLAATLGAPVTSHHLQPTAAAALARVDSAQAVRSGRRGPAAAADPEPAIRAALAPILGHPEQGQHLSAGSVRWSGRPLRVEYSWFDCDAAGRHCSGIPDVSGRTYTVRLEDLGFTIRVRQIAVGTRRSSRPVMSAFTAMVAPAAPQPVTPPTFTGAVAIGQTLSEANGIWSNTPISYRYQWQRCDAAATICQPIPGATEPTLTVTRTLAGARLRVTEIAVNGGGASKAAASTVSATVPSPPVIVRPPAVPVAPPVPATPGPQPEPTAPTGVPAPAGTAPVLGLLPTAYHPDGGLINRLVVWARFDRPVAPPGRCSNVAPACPPDPGTGVSLR
jgi:hypothetical protein